MKALFFMEFQSHQGSGTMNQEHENPSAEPTDGESSGTPLSADPGTPEGPSAVRRIIGLLVIVLFFALIGGAGALYYVYVKFLDGPALKAQFEKQVSAALGMPVTVAGVALDFPRVDLSGIKIGSGLADQPSVVVSQISATPDLWDLLSGKVVFEQLQVSSASIEVTRDASGHLVLPPAVSAVGAQEEPPGTSHSGAFPLHNFDGTGIRLTLRDASLGQTFYAIINRVGLSPELPGRGIPLVFDGNLTGFGELKIDGHFFPAGKGNFHASLANLNWPALKKLLPATVTIPPKFDLSALAADISLDIGRKLEMSNVRMICKPNITVQGGLICDSLSPLNGKATLSFSPVQCRELLELTAGFLPDAGKGLQTQSGNISGGAEIRFASGTVIPDNVWFTIDNLKGKLPNFPVPINSLNGKIAYREGSLTWERLEVEMPGIKAVSAKGAVDVVKGFTGKSSLELQMQPEIAQKAFASLLPETVNNLNPVGTVSFMGTLNLHGGESSIDGVLGLQQIRVLAPPARIPIEVAKGKMRLVNLGKTSGTIEVDELVGRLMGSEIKGSGNFTNSANPTFKLVTTADVDLAKLHAALPVENDLFKKQSTLSGKASVEADFGGTLKKPELAATVRFSDADFAMPEKKLRFAAINGTVKASLNSVSVEKLRATMSGGKLNIDGRLDDFTNCRVNATATLTGIDLIEVKTLLNRNFPTFPKALDISGKADLEIRIGGLAKAPGISGTAVMSGDRFEHPALFRPLTHIVGPVRFDNAGLQTQGLQMNWGSSTVRLVGKIEDWAIFRLAFDYAVQPLDLTDVGQFFLTATGYKTEGMGSGEGKVSGPIDKIVIAGTARFPNCQFEAPVSKSGPATFKFPFANFTAPFRMTEGIMDLTNIQADIFSGKVGGSGKIFLAEKPIRFQFDTKATAIETQQFLALNSTQKNVLSGPLNLTFKAAGNTTGLISLDGGSTMDMKKGHYQSPPVVGQIMGLLNASNLSAGDLNGLTGGFVFKGGQIHSDDMLFKTSLGDASYKGTVGLDTSLSGTMVLHLTPEACKGSSILQQLSVDGGPIDIPIGVKGSLLAPSIDLKIEKLLETAAKKKVKALVTDAILGSLIGKKEPPPPASGTAPLPAVTASVASPVPSPAPAPKPSVEDKLKKELQKGLKKIFKW